MLSYNKSVNGSYQYFDVVCCFLFLVVMTEVKKEMLYSFFILHKNI